ncbi:MAG: hypothetical protein U9Q74_07280 [Gemmatimonadota bacterium]|nr:hypothetical protein [Gemmatimonadota bacterium]
MSTPEGFPGPPAAWRAPAARAQRIGLGVALGLGLIDLWRYLHYQANPDGVSYIDLAREFATHGPAALVNGYWSPLLPATIGAAYRFLPPTIDTMYATARIVTFLSFVLCALTYHRLLFVFRRRLVAGAPAVTLVALGWAAFVLLIVKGVGVNLITPDMGVAAVAFWIAAEAFSLADAPWRGRRWILAGVVLALGYWWKAILFPVALVWLVCATAVALRRRDAWRGPASGWIAFAAVAATLAVPISRQVGRPTFGETGRLNYLWYVDAAPYVWERCVAPEGLDASALSFGGVRREPVLSTNPMTCALETRSATATLPLWYDPSVYYRTTRVRLGLASQRRALRNNLDYVLTAAGETAPALLVAFGLLALGAAWAAARRLRSAGTHGMPRAGWIIAPLVVAPVGFYLLVYVEFRHIAPFLLVGGMVAALAAARAPRRIALAGLGAATAAAAIDLAWRVSGQTLIAFTLARATLTGRAPERIPVTQVVARELAARGLEPGAHVASLYDEWNAEWAQLAGLRVRAHVPELTTALPLVLDTLGSECARAAWDAALRQAEVTAVVARVPNGLRPPPTFDRLGDTEFFLHRTDAPAHCRAAAPSPRFPTNPTSELP